MSDYNYYKLDGSPCYTVKGADGVKDVKPDIRHARRDNLLPRLSSIIDVIDKPGLLNWRYRQITDACHGEYDRVEEHYTCKDDYYHEMIDRAFAQVKDAADAGTLIHEALSHALKGEHYKKDEEVYLPAINEYHQIDKFITPITLWALEEGIEFVEHELTLISPKYGFGGTTDATGRIMKDNVTMEGIFDWKSYKTKPGKKVEPRESHLIQISAYHMAKFGGIYPNHFGCNGYFSTTEPGRFDPVFYDFNQLKVGWEMFLGCCAIWRGRNKYNPCVLEEVVV